VASDLTHTEAATPLAPATTTAPPPSPALGTAHRGRFIVIYGLLGAVLVAAIAGVAVYATRSISPPAAWSSWKPSGGGQGAAKEIAEHVSQAYRLPDGNQLVDVFAKAPSVSPSSSQVIPIHWVVVRGGKGAANQQSEVTSANSIMYSLCGLGASCAIASGKPSVERGTLVRREILELALYTFKYVGGINHVIAFMPPQPGQQPKYVVYLRKSDLAEKLKLPLQQTLAKKVPLPKTITARETRTIDATTEPRVFSFSLSQTQDGQAVFVFDPLPA
jgi:hypothetical protein